MATVLVSGSAGFIGGYVVEELLRRGHEVVGIDNLSKYGRVAKSYDDHQVVHLRGRGRQGRRFDDEAVVGLRPLHCGRRDDRRDLRTFTRTHMICWPPMSASSPTSCDAAIEAHHAGRLQKVTYLSSSMVFESATSWPSAEGQVTSIPPPISSYGFQKLAVEYFARAADRPVRTPLHPSEAIQLRRDRRAESFGRHRYPLGEREPGDEPCRPGSRPEGAQGSGPTASPRRRQSDPPLHLWGRSGGRNRHGDGEPRGARTRTSISRRPHRRTSSNWQRPYGRRSGGRIPSSATWQTLLLTTTLRAEFPATEKAARVLGFEATTTLSDMLDEVIPWIGRAMEEGAI